MTTLRASTSSIRYPLYELVDLFLPKFDVRQVHLYTGLWSAGIFIRIKMTMLLVVAVLASFFITCGAFQARMLRSAPTLVSRGSSAGKKLGGGLLGRDCDILKVDTDRRGCLFASVGLSDFLDGGRRAAALAWMKSQFDNLKKVMMSFVLSMQLLGGKIGHKMAQSAVALASITTMMPSPAGATLWQRYNRLAPTQKLATTPLYFVSNSGGSPYLQEDVQTGNPNQRIVVYFMSSEDANDYLNEMAQGSPQNINEFRITAVSMEKIVNKIQSRKQSRKLGRFPMSIVYRIQPSSRQCANAESVVAGELKRVGGKQSVSEALDGLSIPMFAAKGLVIRRASGETVTPYYFAYEDLKEDWAKLLSKGANMPSSPPVEVCDFVEVMCLSKGITMDSIADTAPAAVKEGGKEEGAAAASSGRGMTAAEIKKALSSVGIVPPRREIEMIRKYYRNEAGMKNEFSKSKILKPR